MKNKENSQKTGKEIYYLFHLKPITAIDHTRLNEFDTLNDNMLSVMSSQKQIWIFLNKFPQYSDLYQKYAKHDPEDNTTALIPAWGIRQDTDDFISIGFETNQDLDKHDLKNFKNFFTDMADLLAKVAGFKINYFYVDAVKRSEYEAGNGTD